MTKQAAKPSNSKRLRCALTALILTAALLSLAFFNIMLGSVRAPYPETEMPD